MEIKFWSTFQDHNYRYLRHSVTLLCIEVSSDCPSDCWGQSKSLGLQEHSHYNLLKMKEFGLLNTNSGFYQRLHPVKKILNKFFFFYVLSECGRSCLSTTSYLFNSKQFLSPYNRSHIYVLLYIYTSSLRKITYFLCISCLPVNVK